MKAKRRLSSESIALPEGFLMFVSQLRNEIESIAAIRRASPNLELDFPDHWKAALDDVGRRVAAYERRVFQRFGVEHGNWQQLALIRAAPASSRNKNRRAPLKPPPELEGLSQEQWKAIAQLMDSNWQEHIANLDWSAALAHGRPKVRLSPDIAKKMRERKVSRARKAMLLTKDKNLARRITYAERQERTSKKVGR